MKKIIALILSALLVAGSLTACQNGSNTANTTPGTTNAAQQSNSQNTKKLNIVTTIFPAYDWVVSLLGDVEADVTMLLDNGVDLHSYQPTVDDIAKISTCDLFIYVGGESDVWVDDVLAGATNADMKVINLLEVLGDEVKEEEIVEGMEHEHEHEEEEEHEHEHEEEEEHEHEHEEGEEHEHEHEEGEEHEHEHESDEHVWLSLKLASKLCEAISVKLAEIDPANADTYEKNLASYKEKLTSLDKKYAEAVSSAKVKTLLFGDRFPFRYLVDDYGLEYFAAFAGCSAETEASFETIIFLAGKVDELGLSAIVTIEGDNHKIAETIKNNTTSKNQQILMIDSMQATTSKDVANGVTYLSIMGSNLEALKNALK